MVARNLRCSKLVIPLFSISIFKNGSYSFDDADAAVNLIAEFKNSEPTFAILKHNNACGLATRKTIKEAYLTALACDPTSAFGGVLMSNCKIDVATAAEINALFCEVVIAPSFDEKAIEILSEKKNPDRRYCRQGS